MDLTKRFKQARDLVREFYQMEIETFPKVSWGDKSENFTTHDPFNRVRTKPNRIILKHTIDADVIWHIDVVKGFIHYYFPPSLQKSWSGWNMATLIALLIIPSSQLTDSKKLQYRKIWLHINQQLLTNRVRFNYDRWFKILIKFPKPAVQSLLIGFVKLMEEKEKNEVRVEDEFNSYLRELREDIESEDEKVLIAKALKFQTIEHKELIQYLDVSDSSLYRMLGNLTFQLNEFYWFNPGNFGLSSLMILVHNSDIMTQIKEFPYIENDEILQENETLIVKSWIPFPELGKLMQEEKLQKLRIFQRFLDVTQLRANPYLFDLTSKTWQSVLQHRGLSTKTISVTMPQTEEPKELKSEELRLVKEIILSRTTDYRKLSIHQSQSKTKRMIKSLEKQQLFFSRVLWAKPSKLRNLLLILPLSDWKEKDGKIPREPRITSSHQYQELISYPWPYISVEFAIEYYHGKERDVSILRVSAIDEDLSWLQKNYPVIGVYKRPTGTNPNFPVGLYEDGKWKFEFEKFVSILT